MGAIAILFSSATLGLFHVTNDEWAVEVDRKPDLSAEQRARQKATFEEYTSALEHAKSRVVPLAVAEILLGAAMVVFAQRATVGRSWARHALVQLTVAHMALSVLEWMLTRDLRAPEDHFQLALSNVDPGEVAVGASKLLRVGLGIGASTITLLGLTMRGSRAFYNTAPELPES